MTTSTSTAGTQATAWLCSYLDSGLLPPALAALDAEVQLRTLRRAAVELDERSDFLWLGGKAADFDQRVAWFRRWLRLWPGADHTPWLVHRDVGAPAATTAVSADALDQLERLIPALAGERRELAQAVRLAATAPGPVSFDPQQRATDAAVRDAALTRWLARLSEPPLGQGSSA